MTERLPPTLVALCLTASLAFAPTGASAQRYLMRQRLQGVGQTGTAQPTSLATPKSPSTCKDMVFNKFSATTGTTTILTGSASSADEAKSFCETSTPPAGYAILRCTWAPATKAVRSIYGKGTGRSDESSSPGNWTAACSPS